MSAKEKCLLESVCKRDLFGGRELTRALILYIYSYVYMYVYAYIFIYICMNVLVHIYIHTFIYIGIQGHPGT